MEGNAIEIALDCLLDVDIGVGCPSCPNYVCGNDARVFRDDKLRKV